MTSRKEQTAFVPGSFDPFTNGGVWFVRNTAEIYGTVIVGIGQNPDKKSGRFPPAIRQAMINESLSQEKITNASVVIFDASQYAPIVASELGADVIVRGYRNPKEYHDEVEGRHLRDLIGATLLDRPIPTVLLGQPPEIAPLSSTAVMHHVGYEGWEQVVAQLVPKPVFEGIVLREIAQGRYR